VTRLAERFVPAADEVGRLQRGQDEESSRFQALAEQGHYAGRTQPSATRQGIYAAAPSGELLASINTRDPQAVADMLARALARWEELGREERLGPDLPAGEPRRWEARYPSDGLVLRVVVRDLERTGRGAPDDWRAHAWNQDFAWLTREEMLALVPEGPGTLAARAWPAKVVDRLVRCHLLDAVRGQVPAFAREHVERAEIAIRVTEVASERLELELSGRTRAVARGRWPVLHFADQDAPREQERGVETELAGRATFDRAAQRFMRFELVAVGTRWGGTQFNCRGDDLEPAPIGFSFSLSGADAPRVAPAQIWSYGWPPP
jgi:hypothetical protein